MFKENTSFLIDDCLNLKQNVQILDLVWIARRNSSSTIDSFGIINQVLIWLSDNIVIVVSSCELLSLSRNSFVSLSYTSLALKNNPNRYVGRYICGSTCYCNSCLNFKEHLLPLDLVELARRHSSFSLDLIRMINVTLIWFWIARQFQFIKVYFRGKRFSSLQLTHIQGLNSRVQVPVCDTPSSLNLIRDAMSLLFLRDSASIIISRTSHPKCTSWT